MVYHWVFCLLNHQLVSTGLLPLFDYFEPGGYGCLCTSFCVDICFIFLVYTPESVTDGSYVVTLCLTLWGAAEHIPEWWRNFTEPLAVYEGSHFSTFSSTRVFVYLFIICIALLLLMGMKWYVIMALVCTSLTTNGAEHLFVSYSHSMSSLEKYLFWFFVCFQIDLLFFLLFSYEFFIYSSYQTLLRYISLKHFFLFH